jgi:arylsulfatase A-like enzyme
LRIPFINISQDIFPLFSRLDLSVKYLWIRVFSVKLLTLLILLCGIVSCTDKGENPPVRQSSSGQENNNNKSAQKPQTGNQAPNIVVFLIDSLRKDRLGCYGHNRPTSPRIDALAAEGLLFDDAISQAPWTPPAMTSLFTSRFPSQTGVSCKTHPDGLRNGGSVTKLDDSFFTLAEAFHAAGYKTMAMVTNYFVSDKFGLLQGFEKKVFERKASAEKVAKKGIRFVKKISKNKQNKKGPPFFLYLHFMDVHDISAPPPFNTMHFESDMAEPIKDRPRWKFKKGEGLDTKEFNDYKRESLALYDGSITYIDKHIGAVVDFIKSINEYENTIFVVLSDHGDEYWDHSLIEKSKMTDPRKVQGVGHGHTMFGELLDVPMIFHGPSIPKGHFPKRVHHLDVAPTLLALAGIDNKNFLEEGRNLLAVPATEQLSQVVSFSESIAYGYEMKCLQNDRYKYFRSKESEFFFDKANDPRELHDLSSKNLQAQKDLKKQLDDLLNRIKKVKSEPVKLDDETKNELRALGYL